MWTNLIKPEDCGETIRTVVLQKGRPGGTRRAVLKLNAQHIFTGDLQVKEHTPSELQPKSNPEIFIPTWDSFPVPGTGVEPGAEEVDDGTVVEAVWVLVGVGVALELLGTAAPGRHWE